MGAAYEILRAFYWGVYVKIFPNLVVLVRRELEGCKSFLDIGCGKSSIVRYFSKDFKSAGVDLFEPYIEESRKKGIHDEYFKMDVRKLKFKPKSFDAVIALELIEHLRKKEGEKLLDDMERIARKRVIVFTPNGFLEQKGYDGNEYQEHKSGWTVSEMRRRGYRVIGVNGIKFLRGEFGFIRYSPKYFWLRVSDITELFTYHFPQYAFQLLCVKDVG
jgi:SAM-dependent methyltransferase